MKVWLSNLKTVAYNSEDILDELATEVILCERFNAAKNQVRSFLCLLNLPDIFLTLLVKLKKC